MAVPLTAEQIDVDRFWRDGFLIIPDVYSEAEVAELRESVRQHCAGGGGELATGPLRRVLTDGRMVDVARTLLGTDRVVYGGDSSATINGKIRAWHKDNTDREDPAAPDWDDRYTQLRFGIYLQDHTEHSGGLNLKPGAHEHCDLTTGPTLYCRSRPTDLLVWSMRMTHSGAGTLLRNPQARDPEPSAWNAFPDQDVAPVHAERMAIFAHLGADDKHARRYLDYLKTRTYMVSAWRRRPYTPEVMEELTAAGLVVRDMPAEVRDDKRAGLSKNWEPFWYPGRPVAATPAAEPEIPRSTAAAAVDVVDRYARATRRRLRGVIRGARQGWHDAAPAATRRRREAAQRHQG